MADASVLLGHVLATQFNRTRTIDAKTLWSLARPTRETTSLRPVGARRRPLAGWIWRHPSTGVWHLGALESGDHQWRDATFPIRVSTHSPVIDRPSPLSKTLRRRCPG